MRIIRFVPALFALFVLVSCDNTLKNVPEEYHESLNLAFEKAGDNAVEMRKALSESPKEQKEGMAYIISYMPERDLKELTADFLLENAKWAYKAREEYSWCRALPDSIFYNEVLPYVNLNETRELWRTDFFERFRPYVENCTSIYEAIDSVNQNINDIVDVEYNTDREKPDQSPEESMRQHMASCSGLSILLADAFRAVGIPARVAGTPMWTNMRGNHNWCEVWIDGEWYFTEYYPDQLNHSWFLADAGKADPETPIHWMYAASWKPAETYFPLVWDESITYVHAYNVTDRYIRIYQEQLTDEKLADDEILVNVMLFKENTCSQNGDHRVSSKVEVSQGDEVVDFGYTAGSTDDLNKFLKFKLKKGELYSFVFTNSEGIRKETEHKTSSDKEETVKLYQEI